MQKQDIPIGSFSSWLHRIRRALITQEETIVDCGECRACCTSSYFIHIAPDETRTRSSIPKHLLFAAPGSSTGNLLLGYNEKGHCPMFIDNTCSIYAHRPFTCRSYDCRIFAATGLPAGDDRPLISQQACRWKFDLPTPQDHKLFSAVHAAATFLHTNGECFPEGFVPRNSTQQAVLAVKVYPAFLDIAQASETSENTDQNQD
ncbi:MAG: YkgJ family cysteine cluster protein, partial [Desulfobacterales bacterium]